MTKNTALRRVKFQNSIAIKIYTKNESKIKIIPCAVFLYSINCRVKSLQALISSVTKCRIIYRVTLQFFKAMGPGCVFTKILNDVLSKALEIVGYEFCINFFLLRFSNNYSNYSSREYFVNLNFLKKN
jgi:hypothetical protein